MSTDCAHTPIRPKSLRDRIAQLLFVRIGSNLPPVRTVDEDADTILSLLENTPIGGLVLFNGRWPESIRTLERLQSASAYPLLVGSDIERGTGQQMHGLPLFPHAMAFDQLGDDAESAVGEFAEQTAREARQCGIQIAFAPVADVNTDPRNPIIATRAFGMQPQRTAKLVTAYVRFAEQAGLFTTAKHFPGHGHTHQDSHDSLPVVPRTRHELDECDLIPFRAACEAGASLVMTAHVSFPALDDTGKPATISRPIVSRLLRGELGFSGAVCSDSLLMAGVRDRFASEAELARETLQAGVDILLDVDDAPTVIDALVRDVESGSLDEAIVDEAFERVWGLKERAWPNQVEHTDINSSDDTLALDVAQRAIRVSASSEGSFLPGLASGDAVTLVCAAPHGGSALGPLRDELRRHVAAVREINLDSDLSESALAKAFEGAEADDHLVVALIVKPAAWHRFGLSEAQTIAIRSILANRPGILVSLGVPYVLDQFPEAAWRVCTYSDVPVSQRALARKLTAGNDQRD